ncbi:MAG TPA: STAS/SEC14 domain-containing protein [Candidatus Dormibacteraeota bacterium]|nr:STAS/SEC14 domain-containing protein [Candidatus Dormibacteraeota bacterium]
MASSTAGNDLEFDIPGVVSLDWDTGSRSVFVVWKGGGTGADFYALLEAELRALRARSAQHLLADLRRQPPLDAEAQDFGDHEWLPRALAAGLKRFAIVVPDNRDAAVNVEDRLGSTARDQLEVGFFHSVDAAREWLNR